MGIPPEQDGDGNQSRRRRASKACIRCNTRKVRCDVSRVPEGTQCTNCRLDDESCTIRPRLRQRRPWSPRSESITTIQESEQFNHFAQTVCSYPAKISERLINDDSSSTESIAHFPESRVQDIWQKRGAMAKIRRTRVSTSTNLKNTQIPTFLTKDTVSPGLDGHLIFSYFSFLKLDGLSSMSADDARTLEGSGCLHIPTRPVLDQFVQEYFLHVHPNLPMVDEGQFWKIYAGQEGSHEKPSRISLFLFQAMLFSASSCVPLRALQRCGFRSVREARKTLYRRAKILFDFEAEHDPRYVAQGSLLLSFYSTNSERHLNTFWLSIAIQSARADGAHRYDEDEGLTRYEKQMKKRLWWCCLLRDRILPLGVRRPLQITRHQFDCRNRSLDDDDLSDDIGKSEVYDPETQRLLAKILIAQCNLAVEMTDAITILYPSDNALTASAAGREDFRRTSIESERCKSKLIDWYEKVQSWVSKIPKNTHPSVTLYTSLLYIYYHSARLALCNHKILAAEISEEQDRSSFSRQLDVFRGELRTSAAAVTYIVQDLLLLDLAQHLPISAMAYAALPLVLSALDIKLSSMTCQIPSKIGFNALDAYTSTMKCFENRFDGTEEVSSTMDRILSEAESQSRRLSLQRKPTILSFTSSKTDDWYDMFVLNPKLHLRVAMAFDLSFSRGKFPEDEDFPKQLRVDRLDDQVRTRDVTPKVEDLRDDGVDEDALASILLRETSSPLQTFGEVPSKPTRTDLDFMELFTDNRDSGEVSTSTDLSFIDSIFQEGLPRVDDGQAWEREVMDLFNQSIPG